MSRDRQQIILGRADGFPSKQRLFSLIKPRVSVDISIQTPPRPPFSYSTKLCCRRRRNTICYFPILEIIRNHHPNRITFLYVLNHHKKSTRFFWTIFSDSDPLCNFLAYFSFFSIFIFWLIFDWTAQCVRKANIPKSLWTVFWYITEIPWVPSEASPNPILSLIPACQSNFWCLPCGSSTSAWTEWPREFDS